MTAPLSLSWLFRGVHAHGAIMALTAYFDDTASHRRKIVGWLGYVGDDLQWGFAEKIWTRELRRRGLGHFHMAECEAGYGPYGNQTERDMLKHDLRQAIIGGQLYGLGVCALESDWEEIVPAELVAIVGDAEQTCIAQCVYAAQDFSRRTDKGEAIRLVFDTTGKGAAISAAVDWHNAAYGRNDPYAFASMKVTPGIQMADYLAWHVLQVSKRVNETNAVPDPAPHFRQLVDNQWMDINWIGRPQITALVEDAKRGKNATLRAAAGGAP